eukprot:4641512-Amphidinium_carterae.1
MGMPRIGSRRVWRMSVLASNRVNFKSWKAEINLKDIDYASTEYALQHAAIVLKSVELDLYRNSAGGYC